MGIGVKPDGPYEEWSVPLVGLGRDLQPYWLGETWVVSQLEHLVHKLKTEPVHATAYAMRTQPSGIPELVVTVYRTELEETAHE